MLAGEVGANSRRLMLLALGAGLVFTSLTHWGAVAARRRDFGRQRALGASRGDLAILVLAHVLTSTMIGLLLGSAVGLVVVWLLAGALPGPGFVIGVNVLVLLAALDRVRPTGDLAARRDPVRILAPMTAT